jgi:hypothetical protein
MKKSPIPIGYFQDSGETTRLLLALRIAHVERDKIDAKTRKIMARLSKAHWLPATDSASRLRRFAAERGVKVRSP